MGKDFSIPPPGAWPVLFTPFTAAGNIDHDALDGLVEFYIERGVAGLFALCLSSEVFELSPHERSAVLGRVVDRVQGRIAVVAGGNFGDDLAEQAHGLGSVRESGADASVILLSLLPSGQDLAGQLLALGNMVSGPLGVYECPVPEHRLLSPPEVGRIAQTGRYVFMKETSRKVDVSGAKIRAAAGTPLQVFQANLKCTPDTMAAGARGYCGVIANVCPEMCRDYCNLYAVDREEATRLFESMLAIQDLMLGHGYPASGKYILSKRGLKITTVTRSLPAHSLPDADRRVIDKWLANLDLGRALADKQIEGLRRSIRSCQLVGLGGGWGEISDLGTNRLKGLGNKPGGVVFRRADPGSQPDQPGCRPLRLLRGFRSRGDPDGPSRVWHWASICSTRPQSTGTAAASSRKEGAGDQRGPRRDRHCQVRRFRPGWTLCAAVHSGCDPA